MLKVLAFMKQVATGLQMEGNFGTAHVYRSSLNAIIAYCGEEDLLFSEVTSEWLKGFEVYLRSRGCSWNTVSTYLRTFRAVYNRAVDLRKASYVPHLFRSVYTGTRADHKRALGDEDMKKVFAKLSRTSGVPFAVCQAQELFILMFSLRGMPFVDLAYLRKSDLRDNVITYRRRKTGQQLFIRWEKCMQEILDKYPVNETEYLLPIITKRDEDYRKQYANELHRVNHLLKKIGKQLDLPIPLTMYVGRHSWASIAKSRNVPISVISEGMGHDSENTTQIYLASLDTTVVDKANKRILDLL